MIPKHLKPQRGLGKEITAQRRKQRDALRRRRESHERQSLDRAREELARRKWSEDKPPYIHSLVAAVADNQTAVLRSMGLPQGIVAHSQYGLSDLTAYTDFRRIFVNYPISSHLMPDGNDRAVWHHVTTDWVIDKDATEVRIRSKVTYPILGVGDDTLWQTHRPKDCCLVISDCRN